MERLNFGCSKVQLAKCCFGVRDKLKGSVVLGWLFEECSVGV